jgi:hypothetical protein
MKKIIYVLSGLLVIGAINLQYSNAAEVPGIIKDRVRSQDSLWDSPAAVQLFGVDDWHKTKEELLKKTVSTLARKHRAHTYAFASISYIVPASDGRLTMVSLDFPFIFSSASQRNAPDTIERIPVYCINKELDATDTFEHIYARYVRTKEPLYERALRKGEGYMSLIKGEREAPPNLDELFTIFAHAEQAALIYIDKHKEELKAALNKALAERSISQDSIIGTRIDMVVTRDMCPSCHVTMNLQSRLRLFGRTSLIGITGMEEHRPAFRDARSSRDDVIIRDHPDYRLYLSIKMV